MDKEYELNAYLAELINKNVTIITGFRSGNGVFIEEKYGMVRDKYAEWTPLNKLYQAFEVLEEAGYSPGGEAGSFSLGGYCNGDWKAVIRTGSGIENRHKGRHKEKTKAIIGAICKAEGIYEEFEECFD